MKIPDDDKNVLLVDDEGDIRDVVSMTLMDMGYRVRTAENGEEALALYRQAPAPVVLSDIKMPVLDGIELLRHIKRINSETEVIMITGHGDMQLAIMSLKYEASDFITKPINVDALEMALQRVHERILMRRKLNDYTNSLEQLVREKTELQDHLSSLGLMIGSISHAIKGLMTGLDGGMYLMGKGIEAQDHAKIEEGWQVVKLIVGRIRKLVMDILFYAKKRDLNWERVDVLSIAEEVAQVVAPKMRAQNISFEKRFAPSAGRFAVDAAMVHSALVGILENAVDACSRDTAKPSHSIVFAVDGGRHEVTFTVTDDGIGMDADTREQIFNLFFSSKGKEGTGLGLFVANKVIGQHGGRITVDSTPGSGSRFCINIPKVAVENNAPRQCREKRRS
jgi:signal transduction histidine kinase